MGGNGKEILMQVISSHRIKALISTFINNICSAGQR